MQRYRLGDDGNPSNGDYRGFTPLFLGYKKSTFWGLDMVRWGFPQN
jgi:hypothetical protein